MRLPPTPRAPRLDPATRIVSFYGMVTLAAVLWGALRGHANILVAAGALGLRGERVAQLLSSAALGVATGLLLVLITRELQERWAWMRMLHNEFRHLVGPMSRRDILILAAASAIGEECLFRGALLMHLQALVPGSLGVVVGIVGSAIVFSLFHIGPGVRFLPWTVSALGMGLLLGALGVTMGDLLAPIAVHFTVNLLNLQDIVRRQMQT